jgi:diguanylate cyclase (GGDEF)-like protein
MKAFPLKVVLLIISMSWTVFLLASAFWNIAQHEKEVNAIIRQIGRSSIERDILYRMWNSMHGGVYAPVTKSNPPNDYLTPQMAPRRDLKFSADLTLTLINPAYMTRQLYELAGQRNTVSGHIISLDPVNPQNRADAWEETALKAVGQGAAEYSETIELDGQDYLRMLLPLRTEKTCLKCHAYQGYKVGDMRGGISVTLPVAAFIKTETNFEHQAITVGHLAIWFVGLLGIFAGYAALARGELARKKVEEEILCLAHFDRLTGLVNRNLFLDLMAQDFAMAKRQRKKVALLYIDLDRFKPINDNFGHAAGDAVLQEVGRRLLASVRESDTVARVGGDEFVVVLRGLHDKQGAALPAQKILAALGQPVLAKGIALAVGASIGISCYPDDGMDLDGLLKNADGAMYRAKNRAGGGIEFF